MKRVIKEVLPTVSDYTSQVSPSVCKIELWGRSAREDREDDKGRKEAIGCIPLCSPRKTSLRKMSGSVYVI